MQLQNILTGEKKLSFHVNLTSAFCTLTGRIYSSLNTEFSTILESHIIEREELNTHFWDRYHVMHKENKVVLPEPASYKNTEASRNCSQCPIKQTHRTYSFIYLNKVLYCCQIKTSFHPNKNIS